MPVFFSFSFSRLNRTQLGWIKKKKESESENVPWLFPDQELLPPQHTLEPSQRNSSCKNRARTLMLFLWLRQLQDIRYDNCRGVCEDLTNSSGSSSGFTPIASRRSSLICRSNWESSAKLSERGSRPLSVRNFSNTGGEREKVRRAEYWCAIGHKAEG